MITGASGRSAVGFAVEGNAATPSSTADAVKLRGTPLPTMFRAWPGSVPKHRGIDGIGKAGPVDCGQRLPALPARRWTKPRFSHGAQADNEDPNPLAVRPGTIGRRDA